MDEKIFTFKEDEWVLPKLEAFFHLPETQKKFEDIGAQRELTSVQMNGVMNGIREIVIGKISDADLASLLEKKTNLPFEKALDIQGDIFAQVVGNVEKLLEEQQQIYKDLHLEEFLPPLPPAADPIETIAREIVKKSGVASKDHVLLRRLEMTVVARLKGVHDDAATKEMLEKPTKTGGSELTPEQSAGIIAAITAALPTLGAAKEAAEKLAKERAELERQTKDAREKKMQELTVRFGRVVATPPSVKTSAPAVPLPPKPPTSVSAGSSVGSDPRGSDPKENKPILPVMPPVTSVPVGSGPKGTDVPPAAPKSVVPGTKGLVPSASTDGPYDVAADAAIAASGVALANEDLRRRLRTLVSMYFRDLRDALETQSKLTMPVASGGMGMSDADAEKAMAVFKEKNIAYHARDVARVTESKAQYVAEQTAKVMNAGVAEAQKEKETLETAFTKLVAKGGGAMPVATPPKSQTPPAPPRVIAVSAPKEKAPPPPNLPVEEPGTPGPRSREPGTSTATKESEPDTPSLRAREPGTDSSQDQRTISDVRFTPHLTGPVEELRQLALKDFRRLSKDPREATLKIKDKIDLLDDLGFEVKTQGIKAWQECEVNKTYLSMLRRSLEGTPIVDVAAELEKKREPFLNKDEFAAIMELNRKLRFG